MRASFFHPTLALGYYFTPPRPPRRWHHWKLTQRLEDGLFLEVRVTCVCGTEAGVTPQMMGTHMQFDLLLLLDQPNLIFKLSLDVWGLTEA